MTASDRDGISSNHKLGELLGGEIHVLATLNDVFRVSVEHRTHRHSLEPLSDGRVSAIRNYVLTGYEDEPFN